QDYAYYYAVDQTYKVGDPYAQMILDPYSDKWLAVDLLDDVMPYPYDKVSGNVMLAVLRAPRQYDWKVENFKGVDAKDLIIYELLLRDFTGTEGAAEANGTLKLAMEKLPYLKKLGVNAIELMPIMEFNGNNSWGYNTNFYFATDKAYGSPEDYKAFIDACHENGMAVILDIVFNQTDGLHPWYQLYTIESNPFDNKEAPHAWSVLNDLKQDNPIVQQQWKDVLQYWLKDYKVDGFRFDLVKGLGDNNSYGGGTDGYNQSRVNRMKQLHAYIKEVNPDAYHINELLGDASEDNANAADGQIGWYSQMNGAAGTWAEGSQASLSGFDGYFSGRKSANTIVYAESHDEQRIGYKQNAYGIDGVKDAHDVKMRRLGCVAASMILRPGAHMIWQFGELGNDENTKNDDGSNKTDPKVVRWSDLDDADRKGLYNSYCELNTIRSANPDLFDENATIETAMETSSWSSGYTFHSYTAGGKELIVAINPGSTKMSRVQIAGAQGSGAADYQVISSSYGVNAPTVAMNGTVLYVRNLQPHSYAVITRNVSTGIDDVVVNGQNNVDVIGGQGEIIIAGEYDDVAVFNLAGQPMNSLNVPAGLYIVNVDGHTAKVIVK
ncbi:MAG: hypothetical protein IJY30_04895, partial [Muribaculaceae bacterium]|nr:hypothetical protein [Muribaculaceae bacterium]